MLWIVDILAANTGKAAGRRSLLPRASDVVYILYEGRAASEVAHVNLIYEAYTKSNHLHHHLVSGLAD